MKELTSPQEFKEEAHVPEEKTHRRGGPKVMIRLVKRLQCQQPDALQYIAEDRGGARSFCIQVIHALKVLSALVMGKRRLVRMRAV